VAIRELPPEVVAQIAAGEVVTRAADVVKELVENAIDAVLAAGPPSDFQEPALTHLGTVSVEIADGGHRRIQVADDGCGIRGDELAAAVRRHATSKIHAAEDLDHLESLGFRGEALAAISAVADLTIASCPRTGGEGAALQVIDGRVGDAHPQARREGTTVVVEALFERVPARRKYQRAASAETAYIGTMLQAYALAYPEIGFAFSADGRAILRTPGSGDLRAVAAELFGAEVARELRILRDEHDTPEPSAWRVAITGLAGTPFLHRATRNGIYLTVNRRPIESRSLQYAVEEAYATQIPVGRHPVAIVDISVPADELDANVHPTKREVRLLRDRLVFGAIQNAVRCTLAAESPVPLIGEARGRPTLEMPEGPMGGAPVPLFAGGSSGDERMRPRLGGLRILGQVALTYVICEGVAGLYLVDQHAAHERVLLERLERDVGRGDGGQMLLEPVAVQLPAALRGALEQYVAALADLGFDIEAFGDDEVVVRAVPAALSARSIDRVLQETHETLDAEGAGPDWRERLATLLSCKTALKAGQRLETAEMQSLLDQLDEATLCATCSHGRPTAILLSHSQLEREFSRR
jgi:DNA mismatch repair protein MutL